MLGLESLIGFVAGSTAKQRNSTKSGAKTEDLIVPRSLEADALEHMQKTLEKQINPPIISHMAAVSAAKAQQNASRAAQAAASLGAGVGSILPGQSSSGITFREDGQEISIKRMLAMEKKLLVTERQMTALLEHVIRTTPNQVDRTELLMSLREITDEEDTEE